MLKIAPLETMIEGWSMELKGLLLWVCFLGVSGNAILTDSIILANSIAPTGELPSMMTHEDPPVFFKSPERQFLRIGDSLNLDVEIVGTAEVTFQWYHNGEMLSGETSRTFDIASVSLEDAGKYYVTATNAFGTTFSTHARVSVNPLYLEKSIARQWMEELLEAIRQDYPAPTVHSRNLFSLSSAMWDAWAVFDASGQAVPFIAAEFPDIPDNDAAVKALREEAISFAAFRVLRSRFRLSPNSDKSFPAFRQRMELLGLDPDLVSTEGNLPSAIGNRIGAKVLAFGWSDGANELHEYADQTGYKPINNPMVVKLPGADMVDPNLWQPLALDFFITQNDIVVGAAVQEFLGPNWGGVTPFALTRENENDVYRDPGPPPYLGGDTDQEFKDAAVEVIEYSSWLDPSNLTLIDVSPAARHNNTLGANDGVGYPENPYTGQPYEANLVLRADYGRILAEFWADGPDSETPPGHWNSVANYVSDSELFEKRFEGTGPVLDELEWDVKVYFAMNAAVSDSAIAAWDAKRKYDYARPVSMIRYMGGKGQSSDEALPSYHVEGLPLKSGLVELITPDSAAVGERHEHLHAYEGEIAVYSWLGEPENPNSEFGGVGWIRAVEWVPYQRSTFVTPPFGAYTSGHSTFSRAGAEVLTAITGDKYFPGGISSFSAGAHEFLEFEDGPENDITLTWATYYDAADEAGISRLYGGIHVWADDLRGREMGSEIGIDAFAKAKTYFNGSATSTDWEQTYEDWVSVMITDSSQVQDPVFYEDDPIRQISHFFIEGDLFPDVYPDRSISFVFLLDNRIPGVEFYQTTAQMENDYKLQVSYDLLQWTDVPNFRMITRKEVLSNGYRRIQLYHTGNPVRNDRQFLRVQLEDNN